jgi:AcrR family transcriptional regulator
VTKVKPQRRYDGRRRQEQARHTRAAIVEEARKRFLSDGFGTTTVASIAGAVGVSVDTIYKSFGGKPGLVRAMCESALEGEGPVPAEVRSDALQRAELDPRAIIAGFGALSAEVAPRIAPLLLLLRDAAVTDPEMAKLRTDLDEERLTRMTRNARSLARGGHLRDGLTVKEAGEIMWTYSAPELYELLVVQRRWSPRRYASFIADAMTAALLPSPETGHDPASSPPLES